MTTQMPDLLEVADELYGLPLRRVHAGPRRAGQGAQGADTELAAARQGAAEAVAGGLGGQPAGPPRGRAGRRRCSRSATALREAQASLDGDELRALTKQRRQLTAAVTTQARALAADGRACKVTPAVADQVEATLTAAMVDEDCAAAVRSGLLVAPLASTGVDAGRRSAPPWRVPEALGFTASPRAAEAAAARRPSCTSYPTRTRTREGARGRRGAARRGRGGGRARPSEALDAAAEPTWPSSRPAACSSRPRSTSSGAGSPSSRRALEEVDDELARGRGASGPRPRPPLAAADEGPGRRGRRRWPSWSRTRS